MKGDRFSVSLLCKYAKMSRQNFYKDRTHSVKKSTDKALVVELIKQERCIQSELGVRKLQKLLKSSFEVNDIKIGRDALFDLARDEKLLIKKKKKYCRTTDSRHRFQVYKNLLKDKVLTGSNQAWVCDITYVRVAKSDAFVFTKGNSF